MTNVVLNAIEIRIFIRIMRLRVDAHVLDMETLTETMTVLLTWRIDIGYFRTFAGRYGLLSPFKSDYVVVPKVRWSLLHHISTLSSSHYCLNIFCLYVS